NEDNAITHYINHAPQISPVFFDLNLINYIVRNLTLIITYDYFLPNDSTPGYLLVQQAATLQVELLFYLIAPWLVSLSKKIFSYFFIIYACITFGIIIPLHLLSYNLIYIFLSVLIYFLLGVGSYNILYKKIADKKVSTRKSLGIFATILLYLLFFNIIPLPIGNFIYYTLFFLTIPFIFKLTKSHVIDLFLGKLSYPIYITHFLTIKFFANISLFKEPSNPRTVLIIIVTIIVSQLAVIFIEEPIDRFRQKRLKRK